MRKCTSSRLEKSEAHITRASSVCGIIELIRNNKSFLMQHIIGRRGNKPIFAHIRQNMYLLKFKDHNQARQHLNVFVTNVPNLEGHLTCFCQNYCKKQDFQLSNIWCSWLKKVQDLIGNNKSFLMQQFMEQLTE